MSWRDALKQWEHQGLQTTSPMDANGHDVAAALEQRLPEVFPKASDGKVALNMVASHRVLLLTLSQTKHHSQRTR